MAEAKTSPDDDFKVYDIATNGISLHVTEQAEGRPYFLSRVSGHLLHVAPTDESRRVGRISRDCARHARLRAELGAVGRRLYTPLQTAGDLVGLLDALKIPSAVIVGHDWGATHAGTPP